MKARKAIPVPDWIAEHFPDWPSGRL